MNNEKPDKNDLHDVSGQKAQWRAPELTRFDTREAEAGDVANPDAGINS
ncbi:MAG TPA: hypothetical protein VF727_10455 [Allosphingosinicella sp.]